MSYQTIKVRTGTERYRRWLIELEDASYFFTFQYSKVIDAWHMSIENDSAEMQVSGIPLVLGVDFLLPFHHLDVPPGKLFCFDTGQTHEEAGLDGFDSRVLLIYRTSDT